MRVPKIAQRVLGMMARDLGMTTRFHGGKVVFPGMARGVLGGGEEFLITNVRRLYGEICFCLHFN